MELLLTHGYRSRSSSFANTLLNNLSPIVGVTCLAIMIGCVRFFKKVPGAIVGCFGATAAVAFLHIPIETIGTRFGGIPTGLPHLSVPALKPSLLLHLLSPAVTIAMLGAIESLMSAVVSDRMSHDKHNPNVELIAQGVANVFSPLFGGLPATGAIAAPQPISVRAQKARLPGWFTPLRSWL